MLVEIMLLLMIKIKFCVKNFYKIFIFKICRFIKDVVYLDLV